MQALGGGSVMHEPHARGQASLAKRMSASVLPLRLQRNAGLALTQPHSFSLPLETVRVQVVLSLQAAAALVQRAK